MHFNPENHSRLFYWDKTQADIMPSTRENNKRTKRKSILEAAFRLFSRNGYNQTSIEELAREAGIGKGTVYSYFQTKRDIVRAFCEDELEFTREELAVNTNPDMPLKDQLMIFFMAEFKHLSRNREFGRLYLQETVFPREHHSDKDLEMQNRYFGLLFPIYQKAQEQGELRKDLELLHIAGHFYALYLLLVSCWFSGMIPTEQTREALSAMFDQTLEGLKPKE